MRFSARLGRLPIASMGIILMAAGGTPVVIAGVAATTFAAPATYQYHPNTSVISQASGRVTGVSDLRGLAPLSSTGTGPTLGTDGLGRKFLRFSGSTQDFLRNAADVTGQDPHNMTVFAVVRWNAMSSSGKSAILSVGNNGASPASHAYSQLGVSASTSTRPRAPFLAGMDDIVALQSPAGRNKLIMSAGLQVIGISTATTDGVGGASTSVAVRHYHMDQMLSLTRSIARQTGKVGIEVGRRASGTAGGATSDYFSGDLYELVGWSGGQFTSASYAASADAIRDALMSNWGLSGFTASLTLSGDSRTAMDDNLNFASILTDPGSPVALPATTRVVNMGLGGTGTILASELIQNDLGPYSPNSMLGGGKDAVLDFMGFNDLYGATGAGWPTYTTALPTNGTPNTGRAEEVYNGTALDASFTGWIYATAGIEITNVASGFIVVGQAVNMAGVPAGSFISSYVANSGTNGGAGRYIVSTPSNMVVTSLGAAVVGTSTMPNLLRNMQAWLSRGFKVVKAVETANAAAAQSAHETLRGKVRNNLLADVSAGAGQTYDGKLKIVDLTEITIGGSKVFGANAVLPGTYYIDPTVHFTPVGRNAIVSGGDTPANGLRLNLAAMLA